MKLNAHINILSKSIFFILEINNELKAKMRCNHSFRFHFMEHAFFSHT